MRRHGTIGPVTALCTDLEDFPPVIKALTVNNWNVNDWLSS